MTESEVTEAALRDAMERIVLLLKERDAALASTATATEAVRYWTDLAQAEANDAAAARAEVERLRGLLADAERHAQAKYRERGRDRHAIANERLREALRDLEEACRDVASWSEECVDYSHPARVKARAALAGSPVETRLPVDDEAEARFEKLLAKRREKAESWLNQGPEVSGTLAFHAEPVERKPMFGGFAGVPTGALVVPVETRREQARAFFAGMAQHEGAGGALAVDERRALAERVREACAEAVETSTNTTVAASYARAVRALDLDALLEEP